MNDFHAYDHVDLPPIRPIVTSIRCHRGICPCCRKHVTAPAPEGFEPGSPFRARIEAVIIHLHITQAISFERLSMPTWIRSFLPENGRAPGWRGER